MTRPDKDIAERHEAQSGGTEVAGDKFAVLRCGLMERGQVRVKRMSEAARKATENAPEIRGDRAPQTDPGFLWDFWYPAIPSRRIRGRNLATAMLLEVPLVLGRTSEGKTFAMRDSCPHRGIPLSYGHFDGKNLECSYHGWEFDACSGQCLAIPSLTSHDKLKVERISAGHFPCEERDGYVWVYMNVPGTRLPERLPAVPELETL